MDRKGDGVLRYVHNRRRRTRNDPEPACVLSPQLLGWHMQGRRMSEHPAVVPSSRCAKKPPVRRKEGRAGLPARVSGRHVVRGRQSSPTQEVRPGEQARLVKTVNIQVRWAAAQPGQDRWLPSVATHSSSSGRPASDLGWRSSSKTAPESLSTGSPGGRTPPHGDGTMYSQANVRAGKWLRPPPRALPSVIVDTEKVLREADGSVKLIVVRPHTDGKVFAPGCASRTGRSEPGGARRTQAQTSGVG